MDTLQFRPATPTDASFIARHVLEALHWEMYQMPLAPHKQAAWQELTPICQQPDVLYSYRHATIAELDGQPCGVLVAYDGASYHALRLHTFSQLSHFRGTDINSMADESQAGEWYIDTLAVVPEMRGRGIGRELLQQAITTATERQLQATLLVDPDNPKALHLYQSLGFCKRGEIFAFGQIYWRMCHSLNPLEV